MFECSVALVAGVSTGIYAGKFHGRVNAEFVDIVDEVLLEMPPEHLRLVFYVTLPRGSHDASTDRDTRLRFAAAIAARDL